MKFFLLLILTQYAVNCDDTSNYYVVEVPEDAPATPGPELMTQAPRARRPFRVYWNVPTMQCKSKKILFELHEYGIIQNKDDSFRGESIAILYDPGLFPALLKNESSGELRFRNGGVPQEGNMTLHLDAFRTTLEQSIPDRDFSGVGIIDFESWRPVFRQNFGVLVPYKDVSYEIERKLHWWWIDEWIHAEAKQRFEAAARAFMQTTLSVAKQMRPRALWGYYGFPYCFNMGANNKVERCADNVSNENDGTYWLWSESTALYPSVYSSSDLSSAQLAALIRGRVKEANRVRRNYSPVLPYFWFRYRDGGYLSEVDLSTALKAFYVSNAPGFIIWGSSNDVNTVSKCQNLLKYVNTVLGPAIAKYTKPSTREEELPPTTETLETDAEKNGTVDNTFLNTNVVSTSYKMNASVANDTVVNTRFIPIDPEYPWEPPANYSQEISHYVEEEMIKKEGYNETKLVNPVTNINSSLLMEILLNNVLQTFLNSEKKISLENNTINNITADTSQTTLNAAVHYATESFAGNVILTSTSQYINFATKNPLDHMNATSKKESIAETNIVTDEEVTITTEYINDIQSTTTTVTTSNTYIDVTTDNYEELTSQPSKEFNLFENEHIFDPHDIVTDTAEGTTETVTLTPSTTSVFDTSDVLYDERSVTENDELLSNSTNVNDVEVNTISESVESGTDNVVDYITDSSDVMKQFKKDTVGVRDEFVEYNYTDSTTAGRSEPEQVVIYIS